MTYLRMTHFLKLRGVPPPAKAAEIKPNPDPEPDPVAPRPVTITRTRRPHPESEPLAGTPDELVPEPVGTFRRGTLHKVGARPLQQGGNRN